MSKAGAWSFSRIKAFEQCPKQFYHEKVLKQYTFVETDAMRYGTEFHKACEDYIGANAELDSRFAWIKPTLDALNAKKGTKVVEQKLGLTADLEPCGFYDKQVWFRGIVDLAIIDESSKLAWIIDYKTGKNSKYADKGQLELMALTIFAHYPEVERINAGLLFVMPRDLIKAQYTIENKADLWAKWLAKYATMEKAFEVDVWNPKPNGLCRRHCQVTECPHNGAN